MTLFGQVVKRREGGISNHGVKQRYLFSTIGDLIDLKNITKFNGTNFQLWKFQMLAVFEASGLKEIVEENLSRPSEQGQLYTAWTSKNAEAKCILASSMDFSQLEYLITCQTANEMWQKLSNIY